MGDSVQARIRRITEGDGDAIRWLYDRYAARLVRRLALRFAGRGVDAEDLLHDTYVYLLGDSAKSLGRYLSQAGSSATEAGLEHFLWCSACGIASNRLRSLSRQPVVALEAVGDGPTAQKGDPGAISRDLLERLAKCLRRRGPAHYLYFQLRYRGGLEPREIVEATGWSRKKTYKLKQALDEALDRCAGELGIAS